MNTTDLSLYLAQRASERLKLAQDYLRQAASELAVKIGVPNLPTGQSATEALIAATFAKDPVAREELIKALAGAELRDLLNVAEAVREKQRPQASETTMETVRELAGKSFGPDKANSAKTGAKAGKR